MIDSMIQGISRSNIYHIWLIEEIGMDAFVTDNNHFSNTIRY